MEIIGVSEESSDSEEYSDCQSDLSYQMVEKNGEVKRDPNSIANGRDSEGNRLLPGLTYGLHAEGRSPALGGVFAVWDGRRFLNDVTGEVVSPADGGYTHAMLIARRDA
ncbi:hypothetical protein RA280_40210 [Cupriavidus sp. CV2]|uniref:hypothetical protein n=1 Tax=Cupriavidus ulmosensis TaxID=3065913 RepID=UPI00296B3193|nr:hypothetical protein [Cupriavidus sp. CV2]MDW3687848.1 hypothetical protein [Cupriavidus sp. CV2]